MLGACEILLLQNDLRLLRRGQLENLGDCQLLTVTYHNSLPVQIGFDKKRVTLRFTDCHVLLLYFPFHISLPPLRIYTIYGSKILLLE